MFDECIVLIPCNTLEDFPKKLAEEDACGLLGGWTAAWHPQWLAASQKVPQWARADTLPPVLQRNVLLVPEISRKRLPSRFPSDTQAAAGCEVFYGTSRADFLAQMQGRFGIADSALHAECPGPERLLCPGDFFALGYAWLQVQLMTRRLRYTSNLDEVYFGGRAVAAATAFVQGDGEAATAALHDAFDCLAEERDHYFSSDPNLVDLTLLAPTTLGGSLQRQLQAVEQPGEPPLNVLIDPSLAAEIAASDSPACTRLKQLIDEQRVGLAGGGPRAEINLHHQSAAGAERVIAAARQEMTQHLGARCDVYARSAGETPGDIGPLLARNGYIGAIPIDLAAGSGWREESKLIWQSGPPALDVLVARPIDASQSHGFLALGPDLGQSIDSGEIATALLVHWPDAHSDAYLDLKRATSWGLALGRFWKIDDYFRDGERPFHHYRGRADQGSANWLRRCVDGGARDPLSSAAAAYQATVRADAAGTIRAMAGLIAPPPATTDAATDGSAATLHDAVRQLCVALGGVPAQSDGPSAGSAPGASTGGAAADKLLLVNPHAISLRTQVSLRGGLAANRAAVKTQVFGWSPRVAGRCDATVDVPGGGFLFLDGSGRAPRRAWLKKRRRLAAGTRLSNEFMEVELSTINGGVSAVYSGGGRGNRYSLRLAYVAGAVADQDQSNQMVADSLEVVRGDEAVGEVRTRGKLHGAAGQAVADFTIVYRVTRGSRWLEADITLQPREAAELGPDPWRSYFAVRSAVASDTSSLLVPLRDLLHRASSDRQIDSPAGVVVDEVDHQTLLFTDGRPAHQRVGDRFIDSLLIVRGETQTQFKMRVGFDVREPLSAFRAAICPPPRVALETLPPNPVGWLVACATPDVLLSDFQLDPTQPLTLSLLVITTRSDSRKVKVRFCRDVVAAERETGKPEAPYQPLTHEGDVVQVSLAGHEAVRIRVTLQG